MSQTGKATKRNPWAWIPTLYFAQGIPFIFINMVTMVLFTQLGMSETDAALYTGWLYLPWVIKPFWGPLVDIMKTKRWWTVIMQLCVAVGLAGIAFTLPQPTGEEIKAGLHINEFTICLFFYVFTAFCSATHDIASVTVFARLLQDMAHVDIVFYGMGDLQSDLAFLGETVVEVFHFAVETVAELF